MATDPLTVPRDRLLKSRSRHAPPDLARVVSAFETGHALSEVLYLGNGRYDCPGDYPATIRNTSNRVLGYLAAYRALGLQDYLERAVEGLSYLLSCQSPEGDFPWYNHSYRGINNRDDGLFEAGIAGRAFIEGYQITRDQRYLDASCRTAEWETACPVSWNNNYNMFAVWHLVAHCETTGDRAALNHAVERTAQGGIRDQLPSGGWPGHNSWMWYHGIIVRGLAELHRVLPDSHSFKSELRASLTAAVNRAIAEQLPTGEVPPNPGERRKGHTCPFILHGLLLARHALGAGLDNCIHGLMRHRLSKTPPAEFLAQYVEGWRDYSRDRAASRAAATGETMWQADFSAFVTDPSWGVMAAGAFNCWYPCEDLHPGRHRWRRATSARTGGGAQEIVSTGGRFYGGMGWSIAEGVLEPGRRYRLTIHSRCTGDPSSIGLVMASVYTGETRPTWDPETHCHITRENPDPDSFADVSVVFTASAQANYVFAWVMAEESSPDAPVSLIVDEARITDAGARFAEWDSSLDDFDSQQDMMLLPLGLYLELMRQSP